MDNNTKKILKTFKSHSRIKKFLSAICYMAILFGFLTYVFYGFNQSTNIKLVSDYKKDPKKYEVEKIMTNPRIKLHYNDNDLYDIEAKKAYHKNEDEVILYDVEAFGKIGKITSRKLEIDQNGDHLVFTGKPVLILNKTKK